MNDIIATTSFLNRRLTVNGNIKFGHYINLGSIFDSDDNEIM